MTMILVTVCGIVVLIHYATAMGWHVGAAYLAFILGAFLSLMMHPYFVWRFIRGY